MARRRNSNIEGLDELLRTIQQLEKLPQKCVTKAARKGANVALKAAKGNAPVDQGYLKKSLRLVPEKSRTKGKKVYQVAPDRAYNDVFQGESNQTTTRYNTRTGQTETKNKTSYYPASQEYGWTDQYGHYHPGYRYLRRSIDEHKTAIEKETVKVMTSEIDKIR
ncbi:HK97-gp10 family putative phage morphogenesis protein [Neobacillus vireti]|uniref:HK97-gp10 family putative phage morphogenesis protein n=1 Tax=Neobacillus vireti TaxID=220686 RepID=UPI002FFF2948